jgi:hypothetical protein
LFKISIVNIQRMLCTTIMSSHSKQQ